jgi:hypothetical protein
MRASLLASFALPLAFLLQSCGSEPVEPVPEALPVGCPEAWQPVTQPEPVDLLSRLAYGDGNLFVSGSRGVISLPAGGGAETVLTPTRASAVWVEGDHLLMNGGTYGSQLYSLPATGGTPALIVDGTAGRTELGIGQLHTYLPTATDFFWAESGRTSFRDPSTVWRAPRAGGPPVEIARFTELKASGDTALYFHGVALAPEGLVLGDSWGVGKVVPLEGGTPRTLAVPEVDNVILDIHFLGVDARGVYWAVPKDPKVDFGPRKVVVSPVDGGAVQPVWSELPPFLSVLHAWPDGDGGLVLVGSQLFSGEESRRTTVWSIDEDGNARRLACATPGLHPYLDDNPPAIAPDAFYFMVWLDGSQMQFVRVPRAAP